MFINSRNLTIGAKRLVKGLLSIYKNDKMTKLFDCSRASILSFHTSTICSNYAPTAMLPIPNNIDAAETTRFSPQRARDISDAFILSQCGQSTSITSNIDITADNSCVNYGNDITDNNRGDPHVQSYDCFGAVSLNSVMQSNVPSPFGGMHKFSHLNMPGGQWSQEYKFTSQNLHSSHYTNLRSKARSGWTAYDQNATVDRTGLINESRADIQGKRFYCTKIKTEEKTAKPLSKKDMLKRAFKDYGATVVVFHVAISLASLGGFYMLVSSGIDLMPVLEYLGLSSTTLSNKIASSASTFVVAYAIHKVFAPVRISITLGALPFIVRFLRSKGIFKAKIITNKSNPIKSEKVTK